MKRTLFALVAICILSFGFGVMIPPDTANAAVAAEEEETNYQTCMRICREDGHTFEYCHNICKDLATAN